MSLSIALLLGIIYGPGRYRFVDFLKVGLQLTALVDLVAIALVKETRLFQKVGFLVTCENGFLWTRAAP